MLNGHCAKDEYQRSKPSRAAKNCLTHLLQSESDGERQHSERDQPESSCCRPRALADIDIGASQ